MEIRSRPSLSGFLAPHGGLRRLLRLDVAELARVRGLGDAKAVRVKAALELGRYLAALS